MCGMIEERDEQVGSRCQMFPTEGLLRAIHQDRVRALERAARDRRMLLDSTGPVEPTVRPDASDPVADRTCLDDTRGAHGSHELGYGKS
jgi:hypothetical protein